MQDDTRFDREDEMALALWLAYLWGVEYASQRLLSDEIITIYDWDAIEIGIANDMKRYFDQTHAIAATHTRRQLSGIAPTIRLARLRQLANDLSTMATNRARALARRAVDSIKQGLSGSVFEARSTARKVIDAIKSGGKRLVETIKDRFGWSKSRAKSNAITEITAADTEAKRVTADVIRAEIGKPKVSHEPKQGPAPKEPVGDQTPDIADMVPDVYLDDQLTLLNDFDIYAVWRTREDEKVCPFCAPLNLVPEFYWPPDVIAGPPRHPNCRCFIVHEYA